MKLMQWCVKRTLFSIPFPYALGGAGNILRAFQQCGWAHKPDSRYLPKPCDVVVWWRDQPSSGKGRIGLVHQLLDDFLYTIEGNKSPNVQGFNYLFSRMDKLPGIGLVPDA